MSFLNIMLCYYFYLEAVLQGGVAKNNPTEKQIDGEIQATLKHVLAWKLTEEKNPKLIVTKSKYRFKL